MPFDYQQKAFAPFESPPISASGMNKLTSGQLLENNVTFGFELEDVNKAIALGDVSSTRTDILNQCASSQLAEGRCSTVVSSEISLETKAVEESEASPLFMTSEVIPPHVTYATCTIFAISCVALVSIVALFLGRDVSLRTTPRKVEFTTEQNK